MVINGALVGDLDMMYIESVLQEELTLSLMIRSCRADPPDVTCLLRTTDDLIDSLVCPPPPSDQLITDDVLSNLIVPAPSWRKSFLSFSLWIFKMALMMSNQLVHQLSSINLIPRIDIYQNPPFSFLFLSISFLDKDGHSSQPVESPSAFPTQLPPIQPKPNPPIDNNTVPLLRVSFLPKAPIFIQALNSNTLWTVFIIIFMIFYL